MTNFFDLIDGVADDNDDYTDQDESQTQKDRYLDERVLRRPGAARLLREVPRALQKALSEMGIAHKSLETTVNHDHFWHTEVSTGSKAMGRTPNAQNYGSPTWDRAQWQNAEDYADSQDDDDENEDDNPMPTSARTKTFAGWPQSGHGVMGSQRQQGQISVSQHTQQPNNAALYPNRNIP